MNYAVVANYITGAGTNEDPIRMKCSDDICTDGQDGSWSLSGEVALPVVIAGQDLVSDVVAEASALVLIASDLNQEILFEEPVGSPEDVEALKDSTVPDVALADKVKASLVRMGHSVPVADARRAEVLAALTLRQATTLINSFLLP